MTGVVSVADDGGSTGRLRAMLNVAAVGDIRKCLVALADPENPLTASFEHRFTVGELSGHAVGNLLLVGLIDATGDLEESVRALAQVMGVTGTIVPASSEGVVLVATTEEGETRGQTEVARSPRRFDASASSRRTPAAPIAAVEAIERADVIVIGPGSLFTSVIAACVIPGITQALAGTNAKKVYVANLHPESPRPKGSRSRTMWTRSSVTASTSIWCSSTSAPRSRRIPRASSTGSSTSRAAMASCTMCKNWRWPSLRLRQTNDIKETPVATRVAINGFGRIGRGFLRAALDDASVEIVAMNDLVPPDDERPPASLRLDPGRPRRARQRGDNALHVGDRTIKVFAERDPAALPWGELDIDVVIESTGIFTSRDARGQAPHGRGASGSSSRRPRATRTRPL